MARKKTTKKAAKKSNRKTTARTVRKPSRASGASGSRRKVGAPRKKTARSSSMGSSVGSSSVDPKALSRSSTYGGVSSAAVRNATGKTWSEWFAILDAHGAAKLSHKEIAEYLHAQRGVKPWWSQMVTVGYEQARGMRKKHETKDGFSVSATRVLSAPLSKSWRAFADADLRARWHQGPEWNVSKVTKDKTIRASFGDGSRLDVYFQPKGKDRSQVSVQHSRIRSETKAKAHKSFWGKRLDELRALFETSAF